MRSSSASRTVKRTGCEPGVVDARRCLAWLLQKPGVFDRRYREALGDRMYGCDDCQEVCPPTTRRQLRVESPPGVRAWVVPGSVEVRRAAEAEGLHRVFTDAGLDWREPSCSMCLAANGDIVGPGQRCVSTSNRNFVGRQGPGARTHLTSPAMAAAAAVTGAIADVRRVVGNR